MNDTSSYAPDYSESSFRLVEPGMNEARVVALLGAPIKVELNQEEWTYYYAAAGLRVHENGAVVDPRTKRTVIIADKNGTVIWASGNYLLVDHSALLGRKFFEVNALHGPPQVRRYQPFRRNLIYSETKSGGGYYRRIIALDEACVVRNIVAEFCPD
jgi:hypothetical protein